MLAPLERRACVAAPSGTAAYPMRCVSSWELGSAQTRSGQRPRAATRLANRAPGAAEPMTPSRKRCVPRRPEPCEARRGHPARLTLPWSPWRYHCHCSPPTALGQLRGGGSGACTTRTDQRGRVVREGRHLIEPLATTALERAIEERSKIPGWQACSRTEQVSIALPAPLWESTKTRREFTSIPIAGQGGQVLVIPFLRSR